MIHPLNINVPTLFDRQYSYVPASQREPPVSKHFLLPGPRSPYATSDLAPNSAEDLCVPSCGTSDVALTSSTCHSINDEKKFIAEFKSSDENAHRAPRRRFLGIAYRRLAIVTLASLLFILAAVAIDIIVHRNRDGRPRAIPDDSTGDLTTQSGLGSAQKYLSISLHGLNATSTHHTSAPDNGKRGGGDGYDSLIVFGASYCDNAHARPPELYRTLKPPPYYKGRWTNGYVWNEYLSAIIGPGGRHTMLVDYAFGGATVDNDLNEARVPDLKKQVSAFLSDLSAQSPGAGPSNGKSLIACWIGINSVTRIWKSVLKHTSETQSESEIQQVMIKAKKKIDATVDEIFDVFSGLIHTNAFQYVPPDFLLLPIPPASLLLVNIRQSKGNKNALEILMTLSDSFNARFASNLETFQRNLIPRQKLFSLDIPTIWRKFINEPSSASLNIVNQACLTRLGACKSPGSYLFWDTLHPTTHIHEQLALMMNAVIKA